jgi:O-antigen ligase
MRSLAFILLWLLVLIIPWEGNFVIPGLVSFARFLGLLAFACGLLGIFASGRLKAPPLPLLPFMAYIGWCFLSLSWAMDPESALSISQTYVLLLIFVWLVQELTDTPKRLNGLLRAFVLGNAIMVADVYLSYLHAGISLSERALVRATAEHANANGVAICCALSIVFAYYLIVNRQKPSFELPKWFYWGSIVAAGLAIPLTGSRGGTLSAIPAAALLLFSMRRGGWKTAATLVACIVLVLFLIPRVVPSANLARIGEGTRGSSFQERLRLWKNGLTTWSTTPILGAGAGSYEAAAEAASGESSQVAHNTYVEVLVETGAVGFLLYFTCWLLIVRRIVSLPRGDRLFWLVVLATFLPSTVALSIEYQKVWWLFGALVLARSNIAYQSQLQPSPSRAWPASSQRLARNR